MGIGYGWGIVDGFYVLFFFYLLGLVWSLFWYWNGSC